MKKHLRQRLILLGVLLMAGVSMTAQAGLFGLGGVSWKEEVLLHDGSKIIVNRSQSYGGRHEIGQTPPIKEQEISFLITNEPQPALRADTAWAACGRQLRPGGKPCRPDRCAG